MGRAARQGRLCRLAGDRHPRPDARRSPGSRASPCTCREAPETRRRRDRPRRRLGSAWRRTPLETYFHQMLMTLGGWAQYARYTLWQAELAGGADETITDLLAIRLIWEEALFLRYDAEIADGMGERAARRTPRPLRRRSICVDRRHPSGGGRARRAAGAGADAGEHRPRRRAMTDPRSRPHFASMFVRRCSAARWKASIPGSRPWASPASSVLPPRIGASPRTSRNCGCRFCSIPRSGRAPAAPMSMRRIRSTRFKARAKRAWGRFKLAAVSSFAFVEATGPVYVGKLLTRCAWACRALSRRATRRLGSIPRSILRPGSRRPRPYCERCR